ncbi:DUF1801 domain-containing protein [Catalinimonas sp. 4WD22]|uniref:YdeI/OmpD-associated family protein n=1 Tax=Catalinimonas locisalis TaxID=3133978 RepID=UPI003101994D
MEKVDKYINKAKQWKEESKLLRDICLGCGLEEGFKWMHPCYTFQGKNIVLIHGFKDYCALFFHKGALLNDADSLLIQQTENVQSARQVRFTSVQQIEDLKPTIKAYIFEAIEVEKAGLEVKMKKTSEYYMPTELEEAFAYNHELKVAFKKLTPGRQRGYLLYFSQPKQSKTRKARIVKSIPKIIKCKGYNEQ